VARLALDDGVGTLRTSIPALTRSSARRALQRQGVSRLPRATRPRRSQFAAYEIGYFHVDFAELRTAREKAYLFAAVDRTTKVAFVRVYRRATSLVAAAFLKVLARAVPYRIHTVLTDDGIQFGDAGGRRVYERGHHPFGRVCRAFGIEHRFTKPYHPSTNGQAERMVRTLKEATVRAFHYAGIAELRRHVADCLTAYNYAKHLKALRWRTPFETREALWATKAELFRRSPDHLTLEPNT
jgi:transposase InsO family protein